MRKIIVSEFVSADGYMVGPNGDMSWVINNFNDELGKHAGDLMESMDTVLLGRVTYEIMVGVWPNQTEATYPGATKMNSATKVVLSTTLDRAPWGKYEPAKLIKGDVARQIKELKLMPGKNIVIYGSGNMVRNLAELDFIDEYQLLVFPIFLGAGKLLFRPMKEPIALNLLKAQPFSNGVSLLIYEPKNRSQPSSG